MYMTTLPLADVRARLSKLVDEASSTHERIEITRNGRRAAVILGAEDYDSLVETLEVLADPKAVMNHYLSLEQIKTGDVLDLEELRDLMRQMGRDVDSQ
jgi:prevent-host-death family protein